jgi:hypothetical protein
MNQVEQLNNLKILKSQAPPAAIPPPPPLTPRYDEETIQAMKLNAKRDLNRAHPFQFWVAYQNQINDFGDYSKPGVPIYKNYSPDMHAAILRKWKLSYVNSGNGRLSSSFYGSDGPKDFTNWTDAEIYYYSSFSDFLGINFKKIFHNIGHAIGSVGSDIGRAAKWTGLEVSDAAHWASQEHAKVGEALHIKPPSALGNEAKHFIGWLTTEKNKSTGEINKVLHAVEPYWKVIATAGLVVLSIASFGIAAPLAISMGAALLTGLDQIKPPEPPLGGGDGIGPDSGGGAGFLPDGTDDGGGTTPEQAAAAQAAYEQQQAAYQEAVKKHRKLVIMILGAAIAAVIISIVIWHHKKHKK